MDPCDRLAVDVLLGEVVGGPLLVELFVIVVELVVLVPDLSRTALVEDLKDDDFRRHTFVLGFRQHFFGPLL